MNSLSALGLFDFNCAKSDFQCCDISTCAYVRVLGVHARKHSATCMYSESVRVLLSMHARTQGKRNTRNQPQRNSVIRILKILKINEITGTHKLSLFNLIYIQ